MAMAEAAEKPLMKLPRPKTVDNISATLTETRLGVNNMNRYIHVNALCLMIVVHKHENIDVYLINAVGLRTSLDAHTLTRGRLPLTMMNHQHLHYLTFLLW